MTISDQTDQLPTFAQLPTNVSALSPERDGQGRFLTGNSGGGRPKGSRNKLTERFMDTNRK